MWGLTHPNEIWRQARKKAPVCFFLFSFFSILFFLCVWAFGGWPVEDMSKDTTLGQYYDPSLLIGCMTFVWITRSECKTQTDAAVRHR